ncbi:MAG: MlaD family protein, partial [Pseudomonadota bacterium]
MNDHTAPEATPQTTKRKMPSPIWLVPIFALLLAGSVAFTAVSERGPLVEIRFKSASGIEAGKTHVRFKDLVVGEVESVELSEDLAEVIVHARLEKSMSSFLGDTTQFWVVSARVTGTQVSGLNTLLSGSYIAMNKSGEANSKKRQFTGLEAPPLTEPGTPGRRVTLTSERGGALNVGSLVYYRQLPAGRIESRELSNDGRNITFTAFIDKPFDTFITSETRFWNVSGFTVEADADGFAVKVESMAALLSGGVAFRQIDDKIGSPLAGGATFTLFPDRDSAAESLFNSGDQLSFLYTVEFSEAIGGLKPGAPIQYEGITVGRVADVVVEADPLSPGPPRIYAVIRIEPSRLTKDEIDAETFSTIMNRLVASGLRMQLGVSNLLSGALNVNMVIIPDAEEARIDLDAQPYPAFPTAPSEVEAIARDVQEIVASLAALPLDDLVVSATSLLQETERLVSSPSVAALPQDVAELARTLTALSAQAEGTLLGLSPDSE